MMCIKTDKAHGCIYMNLNYCFGLNPSWPQHSFITTTQRQQESNQTSRGSFTFISPHRILTGLVSSLQMHLNPLRTLIDIISSHAQDALCRFALLDFCLTCISIQWRQYSFYLHVRVSKCLNWRLSADSNGAVRTLGLYHPLLFQTQVV